MNFLEALVVVFKDQTKMACPVVPKDRPGYGDGIYFDPIHSWMWDSGRKAGLPIPTLTFGEWEVVGRTES